MQMVKRRTGAVSLAALAVTVASAVAGTAAAGGPQPLPQAQASALIAAPAAVQSGSSTRAASPQEVVAAASAQGATVSVAPGMTLLQAVGLAPVLSLSAGASSVLRPIGATTAAIGCWANAAWWEWGTWPYEQHLTDTTYWCAAVGDHITTTTSNATASGTLCGTAWTSSQIIGGGIGASWFVTRSSAQWNCPTVIPWVTLHPSHHEDISRNDWGSTENVGTG
jgi:hypothetical protein